MSLPSHADPFAGDPFRSFYNLDGFTSVALTTDIDWAPDYAVEDLLLLVADAGFPITAFATHASSVFNGASSTVEIGLHPDNTRPHPEFGLRRKILDLKTMFPDARGVRAHRNFFGQNVAQMAADAALTYDASVFQWRRPYCQAFRDQYGLVRMSYNWEDGIQADMGLPWSLEHVPMDGPGLKIFNVHPIFIYLNCPDDDYRRRAVKDFPDLTRAPRDVLQPLVYPGYGARSFLVDLLRELKARGPKAYRLSEIAVAGVAA